MDSLDVKTILSNYKHFNILFVFDETDFYYLLKEKGQYKMQIKYSSASSDIVTTSYYHKMEDALEYVEPLGFKLNHSLKHDLPYELINLI